MNRRMWAVDRAGKIAVLHRIELNTAAPINAYILADRGTWLSFKNPLELGIAVERDPRLFNQYSVMLVNPSKHPHVNKSYGQQFIDWIISAEGQQAIASYQIKDEQLFFPNAGIR